MAENYFDPNRLAELVASIEVAQDPPQWLAEALVLLGQNQILFPSGEDENRFVVEFIYPH